MSRPTLSELRWPMDNESRQQAEEWALSFTVQALDWTWRAFDALSVNVLSLVDLNQPLDQVERDLTSKHYIEINRLFAAETEGFSSVTPHHEFPENDSSPGGSGRPPASDLSFIWYENQRVSWPIEAKVLKTSGTLAEYLKDTAKFQSGTVAPFVGEGGQIAYLLGGSSDDFFLNLQSKSVERLEMMVEFSGRSHRIALSKRPMHCDIRLHHMAMSLNCVNK